MPISVRCDDCGHTMRVRDQLAGKTIKCSDCSAHCTVPAKGKGKAFQDDEDGPSEYQLKEAAGRKPRAADEDEDDWDDRPRRKKQGANPLVLLGAAVLVGGFVICAAGGFLFYLASARAPRPVVQNQPPIPFQPQHPQQIPNFGGNNNNNPPQIPQFNQPRFDPNRNAPNEPPRGFQPAAEQAPLKAVAWRGRADPQVPLPELTLTEPLAISAKLGHAAIFPRSPSLFVALGTNNTPADERQVWDLQTGKKTPGAIKGHRLDRDLCALSADGRYFAARDLAERNSLKIIDVKTGKFNVTQMGVFPKMLAFGGSSRLVLFDSGMVKAWPMPPSAKEVSIKSDAWDDKGLALSHGGNYLAMAEGRGREGVTVYDLETGQSVGVLPMPPANGFPQIEALAFTPDGTELVAYLKNWKVGTFVVWNLDKGELTKSFQIDNMDEHLTSSAASYKGGRLQCFPDNKRWLLYGELVIDRELESPAMKLPGVGGFSDRHIAQVLPNGHVAIVSANVANGPITIASHEITEDKVQKAQEAIAQGGTAADANMPKLTAASWAGTRVLNPEEAAGDWKVENDPAPEPKPKLMPATLTLYPRPKQFVYAALTGGDVARLVAQYGNNSDEHGLSTVSRPGRAAAPQRGAPKSKTAKEPPAVPESAAFLDVYDLTTGTIVATAPIPFDCRLMSVSPDGKRACVRIFQKKDRLDVFETETGQHVAGWRPYQDSEHEIAKTVTSAEFVDNDHILTRNEFESTVALWDVKTGQAVYSVKGGDAPRLSPGHKYVIVTNRTARQLNVYDALTGDLRGSLEVPGYVHAVAFHPGGELVAAIVTNTATPTFMSWRMSDGQLDKEFPLPNSASEMQWCGRTFVLAGREMLDLSAKTPVWNYNSGGFGLEFPSPPDTRVWYMSWRQDFRNPGITLNALTLPHKDAEQKIIAASPRPDYVIEPGSTVSLQVNLGVTPPDAPNLAAEVASSLRKTLQQNGCNVVDNAPVVIQVSSSNGMVRDDEYVTIQAFGVGGNERIKVERVQYQVVINRNGQKAWESGGTAANAGFGIVNRKENETFADVLRRQMWGSFANGLRNFQLPKYVVAGGKVLGTSTLGADGLDSR